MIHIMRNDYAHQIRKTAIHRSAELFKTKSKSAYRDLERCSGRVACQCFRHRRSPERGIAFRHPRLIAESFRRRHDPRRFQKGFQGDGPEARLELQGRGRLAHSNHLQHQYADGVLCWKRGAIAAHQITQALREVYRGVVCEPKAGSFELERHHSAHRSPVVVYAHASERIWLQMPKGICIEIRVEEERMDGFPKIPDLASIEDRGRRGISFQSGPCPVGKNRTGRVGREVAVVPRAAWQLKTARRGGKKNQRQSGLPRFARNDGRGLRGRRI